MLQITRTFLCLLLFICISVDFRNWSSVDKILQDAIIDKAFPGAVAIVADRNGILYSKTFGHFTYDTSSPKMSLTV